VNCKLPKENLHVWLDEPLDPDVYCIGCVFCSVSPGANFFRFQEVDMSANALLLSNVKASAPWEDAIQETLGQKYVMVRPWCVDPCAESHSLQLISKQLVGVMIMVFVKSEHFRHVHDLRFSIVGCGLLGVMVSLLACCLCDSSVDRVMFWML